MLSDYEKACSVRGYTGVIENENGNILILNDMPMDTILLTKDLWEIYICRIMYSEEVISLNDDIALELMSRCTFLDQPDAIEFGGSELVIMDASANKFPDEAYIACQVAEIPFTLATCEEFTYEDSRFVLHRLRAAAR